MFEDPVNCTASARLPAGPGSYPWHYHPHRLPRSSASVHFARTALPRSHCPISPAWHPLVHAAQLHPLRPDSFALPCLTCIAQFRPPRRNCTASPATPQTTALGPLRTVSAALCHEPGISQRCTASPASRLRIYPNAPSAQRRHQTVRRQQDATIRASLSQSFLARFAWSRVFGDSREEIP